MRTTSTPPVEGWRAYSVQTMPRLRECSCCGAQTERAEQAGWWWRWRPASGPKGGRASEIRCARCFRQVLASRLLDPDACPRCRQRSLDHDLVGEGVPRITCRVCAWHAEGASIPAGYRGAGYRGGRLDSQPVFAV